MEARKEKDIKKKYHKIDIRINSNQEYFFLFTHQFTLWLCKSKNDDLITIASIQRKKSKFLGKTTSEAKIKYNRKMSSTNTFRINSIGDFRVWKKGYE